MYLERTQSQTGGGGGGGTRHVGQSDCGGRVVPVVELLAGLGCERGFAWTCMCILPTLQDRAPEKAWVLLVTMRHVPQLTAPTPKCLSLHGAQLQSSDLPRRLVPEMMCATQLLEASSQTRLGALPLQGRWRPMRWPCGLGTAGTLKSDAFWADTSTLGPWIPKC